MIGPIKIASPEEKVEHLRKYAENVSHVTSKRTELVRLSFRNFVCQKQNDEGIKKKRIGEKSAEVGETAGAAFKSLGCVLLYIFWFLF